MAENETKESYGDIDLLREISTYHLYGKWNDYIGVQKSVIGTLREEGFFENNVIMNKNSGMVVKITVKGIKETLSKGKRFQNLPRELKQLKIATLRKLPQIIEEGLLANDDVCNIHGKQELYAYIVSNIRIDEKIYGVRVSIKKRVGDNIFWIHNIDCNEKKS